MKYSKSQFVVGYAALKRRPSTATLRRVKIIVKKLWSMHARTSIDFSRTTIVFGLCGMRFGWLNAVKLNVEQQMPMYLYIIATI